MKLPNTSILIFLTLIVSLAILMSGCGSSSSSINIGTGAISAKLVWNENNNVAMFKSTAMPAVGVVAVRIIVTGYDMVDIQKDFPATAGNGVMDGVPAGLNRTVKAQGLDLNGLVMYQGEVSNITVQAGNTTDVGVINMMSLIPIARAGTYQSVATGTIVILDASGSTDPNHKELSYSWILKSQPNGSSAVLSDATIAKPTFVPDAAGTYLFSLVVNNGQLYSIASETTVTAAKLNVAPVANPGNAQNITVGTIVTLDGSASSDANGDSLTYLWSFTAKPSGSNATLSNTTDAKPTFVPDLIGTYIISLVVNDGKVNSSPTTVNVESKTNKGSIFISW
jgi:hypothetical protein